MSPRDAHADLDLSVVIVNYNVRYFLEQCLHSVRDASEGLAAEVFVVDNDSHDDSLAMLADFPEVVVIANRENVGFARANNQAIRRARGRYVLLLNPDTLVPPDAFRRCLAYAERHSRVGMIGVRMIDGTGAFLPESKRGFPTPWVSFTKMSGLAKLNDASPTLNGYYLGHLGEHDVNPVDVLPGAFMWIRRAALPAVGGGLDEDYFMYGEDIDLSFVMQRAGYDNVYLPEVTIVHYKGESTRKRSRLYVSTFYRAMVIFARKHVVASGGRLQLALLQLAIYARAAVAMVVNAAATLAVAAADLCAIAGVLLAARWAWARYYFRDADYFADSPFDTFNLPLYAILWLGGLALFGAYDRPYRLASALKGAVAGTAIVLLGYALLPTELRTSRAIVLLAGAALTVVLPVIRLLVSLLRPGAVSFAEQRARERRLVIVGEPPETQRVLSLLGRAGVARDYLGRVDPTDRGTGECLAGLAGLGQVVESYRVDELIFCGADVSLAAEIAWMNRLAGRVAFRHVAAGTSAIVGSPSREARGSAYTVGARYELAEARARRRKRVVDVAVAVVLLLAWPMTLLLPRGGAALRNAFVVLGGGATWVGYAVGGERPGGLPRLRPCVLPQGVHLGAGGRVDAQRLNEVYARRYRPGEDLRTIWQNRAQLGGRPVAIERLAPPRWPLTDVVANEFPESSRV